MTESEAYSAKAARAGKDIGKKGKNFDKIAKKAAKRYGSEERGKKVAGAILKKLRMKEEAEQLGEKAPPGKKFERMVKHIKKGYESGGLTKQEKGIAYATAWKSYNKAKNEEVEPIQESYTLYHKSYTDAVNHAFAHHAKSGLKSSDDDRMQYIGSGSKKPGEGKTTRVDIPATHEKTGKKHMIHIQVYNKGGSKPYELNTYSSTTRSMQKESEQVSELSTELLGRYKKAAVDSYREADKRGDVAKTNKRFKGTITATNKQFANDLKKRASKQNEEVEQVAEKFSDAQIAALRTAYSKISSIDPESHSYQKLLTMLDDMDKATLRKVANGNIKFVSRLAINRLQRMEENTNMSIKFTEFRSRLDEATSVTDYNPKSQGGTRKELLAKYAKTKDPKHGEAARRSGATQRELQAARMEEVEQIDEAPYMGKGNHKPGWMLRADPELARKFKEIEDRKKNMNSLMKKYGGKTGDEIAKMKKEEVELDEAQLAHKVMYAMKDPKKGGKIAVAHYEKEEDAKKFLDDIKNKGGHGIIRKNEPKNEEVEQIDERNKENAEKRKTMDASRGASFKAKGYPSPAAEPQHKGSQAHNKMIGRAIRRMSREVPK